MTSQMFNELESVWREGGRARFSEMYKYTFSLQVILYSVLHGTHCGPCPDHGTDVLINGSWQPGELKAPTPASTGA